MLERDLFLRALDMPDAERAAFLDRECANNPELRRKVAALLLAHAAAGDFLKQPHPNVGQADATAGYASSQAAQHEHEGAIIAGRYKLLQQIGEGGMGSVWMADQLEPVKRRVAIKLIRAERDGSKTILSRFEAERQAIALMDHPNIAKLLDAGSTGLASVEPSGRRAGEDTSGLRLDARQDSGRPFFVMELVKGVPLTQFCDEQKLSIPERLNLFMQICSAVQHAHQKGIIHRDLKPTNILVETHDDQPVPKVIDFGLAKALSGQPLTEHTLFTGFGTVAGTPLYMAPEQAKFNAIDIDTRADIYALGIILYELLTGSTPIERDQLKKAALDEILRVIRESEPPTPSKRLSSTESKPSVSANRKSEPAKLGRFVRGELDWIVMKALAKERDRRYETANGFAKDIERFLNHEPVLAGPPTMRYKLRKFVARNKVQVVAASLVLLALVAGMIGTTLGLLEAKRQEGLARNEATAKEHARQAEAGERQKAEAAKVEAQEKEAEANAVVKFFEEQVFAAARPKGQDGGQGAAVTLRDAIASSEPALDKSFTAQPLVEARLRLALGETFWYLAEREQARSQFDRARALFSRHVGPDHPDTLASMNNLAISYADLNRPAEALKLREEVLAIRKRVLPKDHPRTLTSMHNLANSYTALNRHAEALKLREEVLVIQKRVLPKDHPDTLASMNNLAISYADLNRPTEALKLREEVLAIRKRVLPKDHPDTLMSMHNLANSYTDLNRHAEALKLREEVLEIQKRELPKDHPDTLMSMGNLAISYADLNRPAEALKLREEVLVIQKRVLPKDHPDTLTSMHNLANSYSVLNRQAEALKLYEEVLEIRKRVLPKGHPDTLASMVNLASSLIKADRGAEAITLIDEFLPKANQPGVDPRLVPIAFGLRLTHFRKAGDSAGCRATAEMWEKLNRTDAGSLYHDACYRAVTAAVQAKTPGPDAARLARADADKAMEWLQKAVKAGWKDVAHMAKDSDLDPLRGREDFKKLMAELEKKAPAKK